MDSRAFIGEGAGRVAVLESETLQDRGRGLRGGEVDHWREVAAVDRGRARALRALDGDELALEIDVLEVGAGRDHDRVAVGGNIDRSLDGRVSAWHVENVRGAGRDRAQDAHRQQSAAGNGNCS